MEHAYRGSNLAAQTECDRVLRARQPLQRVAERGDAGGSAMAIGEQQLAQRRLPTTLQSLGEHAAPLGADGLATEVERDDRELALGERARKGGDGSAAVGRAVLGHVERREAARLALGQDSTQGDDARNAKGAAGALEH